MLKNLSVVDPPLVLCLQHAEQIPVHLAQITVIMLQTGLIVSFKKSNSYNKIAII